MNERPSKERLEEIRDKTDDLYAYADRLVIYELLAEIDALTQENKEWQDLARSEINGRDQLAARVRELEDTLRDREVTLNKALRYEEELEFKFRDLQEALEPLRDSLTHCWCRTVTIDEDGVLQHEPHCNVLRSQELAPTQRPA